MSSIDLPSLDRYRIEGEEQWREFGHEVPEIHFRKDWGVKVIPPFGGAMARFIVKKDEAWVSVYLDNKNALGIFGYPDPEPYWEVYPLDGDVFRCEMADTEALVKAIGKSIRQQNREKKNEQSS